MHFDAEQAPPVQHRQTTRCYLPSIMLQNVGDKTHDCEVQVNSQAMKLMLLTFSRCSWSRTLAMNKALCAKVGSGAFPSAAMLLQAGADKLQSECGVGYRAKTLLRLAEQVNCLCIILSKISDTKCSEVALAAQKIVAIWYTDSC